MSEFSGMLSKYDYADLRIETGKESSINLKEKEVKAHTGNFFGVSVRVLQDGAWGFACSNNPDSDIAELLKKAVKLSSLQKSSSSISESKPTMKKIKDKYEVTDTETQTAELIEAKKLMEGDEIISTNLSCSDVQTTKEFYSSEGSEIIQDCSYTYLSCFAVARYESVIQRAVETFASRRGFGGLDLVEPCEEARRKAQRLVKAEPPPRGRFNVILDPEMTGVLTHESVGHAAEADSIASKESIFAGKKGQRIGSELVNIADDPLMRKFGYYEYDDEGVEGRRVGIIENGILKGYINSRETSAETGEQPNGHARSEDFSYVPIVRMSNTFFLQGDSSESDIFDVEEGLYLKGMLGGSVDTFTGGFMFKAAEAFTIKNGSREEILRDVTITGNLLEVLKNVDAVGKDLGSSPGMCGKLGQGVPVEDGGPHIRVKDIVVG